MNLKKLHEDLFNATARMEAIVCLAGMVTDSSLPDVLRELLEEDEASIKRCFDDIPQHVLEATENGDDADDAFSEWVVDEEKFGFVIKFATPVMKRLDGGGSSYSWGYYNTGWVYGDTFDEAVAAGMEWVAERRAAEKAKAAKKATQEPAC